MNCDGVRGLLSAYLDGELTSGELLRVEQHLRRCHACASEVESLRKTIALVAGLDEVPLPADFHAKLHQRLVALGPPAARRPAVPAWQRGLRTWAVPAAAAAAALAVGLSTMQGAPTSLGGILAPPSVFEQGENTGTTATEAASPRTSSTSSSTPTPVTTPNQPVVAPNPNPPTNKPESQPPTTTVATPTPSTTPTVTTTTPAPIGTSAAGLSEAHAVSYFDGLPEMNAIPAYAHEYRFTYRGGDPIGVSKALEAKFAGKVVVTDSQLTLRLLSTEAETAVKAVREILGTAGIQEETRKHDYGAALESAYRRVQDLDGLREQLYQAQAKVTDKAALEVAEKELEGYRVKAAEAKQEISRIQGFVGEATVVIKITKQVQ